jgi:hypothetical protein
MEMRLVYPTFTHSNKSNRQGDDLSFVETSQGRLTWSHYVIISVSNYVTGNLWAEFIEFRLYSPITSVCHQAVQ